MVSFYRVTVSSKKGIIWRKKDRYFLSVLLFNYRNNGRFPFQLIILLVSRPHCTRTGRDKLIVGIVLKYTWYKWYVLCQKILGTEYHFDSEVKFLNLKEKRKKK